MSRCSGFLVVSSVLCAATSALGDQYHVSVRHPAAKDTNPGTAERPFRTISKATKLVKPGDRVLVHSGVYREAITVETSGTTDQPIVFEAAPASHVTVTGAERITEWRREESEGKVFSTRWPYRFIPWNRKGHHPSDDYHQMIGRCEQVHINDYPLLQVFDRSKLSRGTFYVDLEDKRLYVWERANRAVGTGDVTVEASVRGLLWECTGDYVHLRGLRFRYAANPAQKAAVRILGNHSLVEACIIERMNALGAVLGGKHNVIRRCVFQDNGWDGFDGGAHDLLMTECLVRNNNTKGWNRDWGGGGNKIVFSRRFVIERSTFVDNRGHGIWFDIGNEDCVVRNCLIANNENAGIFYEISYGLHAHDNVIVGNGLAPRFRAWGANGGISLSSSPNCLIERNLLVANKEGLQFREQTRTTPRIGNRKKQEPVWNHDHVIRNNTIAYNRDAQIAGWFALKDERHWPAAMTKPPGESSPRDPNWCLEKLKLRLRGNVYAVAPGQRLYQWGCRFPGYSHKTYDDLAGVQRELGLETESVLTDIEFAGNCLTMDFCVPWRSVALKMKCYPQGSVPGVELGALGQ